MRHHASGRTEVLAVRILVVEDEPLMADAIAEGLRRESLAVDVVYDGDAALERLGVNDYDVVVPTGTSRWSPATRCAGRW
jgi:PleD family two-component response regulator